MKKIFEEYGGVITVAVAIVALIGIVAMLIGGPNGGLIGGAFKQVVTDFEDKASEKIDGLGGSGGAGGYNPDEPSLNPSGTIPAGAYYFNLDSGTIFSTMPTEVSNKDAYVCGDYIYTYYTDDEGWTVELADSYSKVLDYIPTYPITDNKQSSYGEILETINGKPVVIMYRTFMGCESLTTAPIIPSTIVDMNYTFYNCTELTATPDMSYANNVISMSSAFRLCSKLKTVSSLPQNVEKLSSTFQDCTGLIEAPSIPESVYTMGSTFKGCVALIKPPIIHEGVTYLANTFSGCTSLTGSIEINSNPSGISECLKDTQITEITGKCTIKDSILATK